MSAARPIEPDELLDLAEDLARGTGSGGRPKTIWLRRSVSTSYYALFHEIFFRVGDTFAVSRQDALTSAQMARAAVQRSRDLAQEGEASFRRFLRLAVGAVKVAKKR